MVNVERLLRSRQDRKRSASGPIVSPISRDPYLLVLARQKILLLGRSFSIYTLYKIATMGLESKHSKNKHSKLKLHSKAELTKPNGKSTLKAKAKAKEGKKAPSPIPTPQEGDSDWESDQKDSSGDEEDDGVDEEGMARLMKALGDDGLDEFGQAQLDALAGESGSEDEDEVEGKEGGSGVEDEDSDVEVDGASDSEHNDEDAEEDEDDDDSEGEGDDDELDQEGDVLLEEVDSVDEDTVPRQKIEIDNKVRLQVFMLLISSLKNFIRLPSIKFVNQ